MKNDLRLLLAGACAGLVAGLLGAGGGMVLVPLLARSDLLEEEELFPASLVVMTGICIMCLACLSLREGLPWSEAIPWLPGSALGGVIAGFLGRKIPVKWLHRLLGLLILWGGWRYLWG